MKKFLFPAVLTTALFGVFACNNDEVIENIVPEDQKSPVEFSMTDASGNVTMANRAGFSSATRIVMQMKSVESGTSSTRYTRTIAEGKAMEGGKQYSTLHFDASNMRYWDDAFGRKANISVFAVAIPDKNNSILLPENLAPAADGWTETSTNSNYSWTVKTTQTADDIANEDLTYSNNIQPVVVAGTHNGYNGRYVYDFNSSTYVPVLSDDISNLNALGEGALQFKLKENGNPEGAGKFDRGHLIFNHALTRLTVHFNINTSNGFTGNASNYFTSTTEIKLNQFRYKGTFDIETGTWNTAVSGDKGTITMAYKNDTPSPTYQAQMLPGYTFTKDDPAKVMEFTIANNTYYITSHMIWKALNDNRVVNQLTNADSYTMEMGKNYDLTITTNKTAIDDITATLLPWQDVKGANIDAENSYITLSLSNTTGKASDKFDLYRLAVENSEIFAGNGTVPELTNWQGDYTDKANLTQTSTTEAVSSWKTNWFFESNKTFYHFRTVAQETDIVTNDGDDYFKIYSGPKNETWATNNKPTKVNDNGKYYDYRWGAPMKSGANLSYNSTVGANEGYTLSLYPAIGSTKNTIHILEQHMMATVNFVLHTGKRVDGGIEVDAGPITLKATGDSKATIITLQNFYGEGKVKVGSGLVSEDNTKALYSTELPIPGITPTYDSDGKTLTVKTVGDDGYFKAASDNKITEAYTYCIVPQKLYHGTGTAGTDETTNKYIGLTIQTPDNNQYYVIKKLYGVKATEVSGTKTDVSVNSPINEWLPGHSYTYHIYINKKGIESVTCTVVDWIDVKGTIGDVDLEY